MSESDLQLELQKARRVLPLLSVLLAYIVCGLSGVNQIMSLALKRYYVHWAIVMWSILAILWPLLSPLVFQSARKWLLMGGVAGYAAGAIAYQLAQVLKSGSFGAIATNVRIAQPLTYLAVSVVFPLIALSWLAGLIAAAIGCATIRRSRADARLALSIIIVVFIFGWAFCFWRRAFPVAW